MLSFSIYRLSSTISILYFIFTILLLLFVGFYFYSILRANDEAKSKPPQIMADSTLQLIPLVPVAETSGLSVSSAINTPTAQSLDLNEDENLCSLTSSGEPSPTTTPTSSSSSNCSPPSSTSLDNLSSDSGEGVADVFVDDGDDVIKEEFLSCEKNEPTLPGNDSLPHAFCFFLTLDDEPTPSTSSSPLPLSPIEPQQVVQQEPQQDPPQESQPEPQPEPQQELQQEPLKLLPQQLQQPPLPDIPVAKRMTIDHSRVEKFCINTCFGRPSRLGFFSSFTNSEGERIYQEDKSSLRYLFIPPDGIVGINLNNVREGNTENLCRDQDYVLILHYISENEYELNQKRIKNDDDDDDDDDKTAPIADIICSSEVLTSIMVTPYKQKNWTLVGIKVRGAIILLKRETDETDQGLFERRKFLEGVTRRHDQSKTHPDGTDDRFYSVNSVEVKNLRLLYTFPIDAAFNRKQLGPIDSVKIVQIEVRSANWDKSAKTRKNFWRNMGLNVWCSTLLGKVSHLIFGGKEPGGWVKQVDSPFSPTEIPKSSNGWSPKTCVDFMYQVLSHIRADPSPGELIPFEISYVHSDDNPIAEIICTPLDEPAGNYIPSWYISNQSPDDDD